MTFPGLLLYESVVPGRTEYTLEEKQRLETLVIVKGIDSAGEDVGFRMSYRLKVRFILL